MSTRGVCDTRCQAFHTSMIQKEESLRIKWFLKHRQQLLDRSEETKTETKDKLPPRPKQSNVDTIRLKPLPNWRPMESDGSINMEIMKPVHPQIRAILYRDAPSFITAENYMLERVKEIPENRYYFPDCSSWVHGWRLGDYPSVPRSKVGQKSIMLNEFYRTRISSLQRDPEWYRPCLKTPTKCDDEEN